MRTFIAPDELPELDAWLADRQRAGADLYDYEIDGVLRMVPAPARRHGTWQLRIAERLAPLLRAAGLVNGGPANLGRDACYIVPDLVITASDDDAVWLSEAVIAIEILSPREDEAAKLADYRAVIRAGALTLGELWYLDPERRELRLYQGPDLAPVAASAALGRDLAQLTQTIFG